jgi:hypothetical protein
MTGSRRSWLEIGFPDPDGKLRPNPVIAPNHTTHVDYLAHARRKFD